MDIRDNGVLFIATSTERFPWGDPYVNRTLRVVVLRRYTFELKFGKPMKVK